MVVWSNHGCRASCRVWTIGSLVVFASIVVHGISATPLIRRYGRLIAISGAAERTAKPAEERA